MSPSPALADRAAGVLLGAAAGDALGAGYEFGPALPRTPRSTWSAAHRPGTPAPPAQLVDRIRERSDGTVPAKD